MLTKIDESTLEQELEIRRRARALLTLETAHLASAKHGTDRLTDEEIREEIDASRASRR